MKLGHIELTQATDFSNLWCPISKFRLKWGQINPTLLFLNNWDWNWTMGLISKVSYSSTVLHIYDFIFIWLFDVSHNSI